jgi:hypothetical protein
MTNATFKNLDFKRLKTDGKARRGTVTLKHDLVQSQA